MCIAGREHKLHYKGENLLSFQLQKAVCVHQLVARLALLLDGLCAPSLWKQLHAASELDSDKKRSVNSKGYVPKTRRAVMPADN